MRYEMEVILPIGPNGINPQWREIKRMQGELDYLNILR